MRTCTPGGRKSDSRPNVDETNAAPRAPCLFGALAARKVAPRGRFTADVWTLWIIPMIDFAAARRIMVDSQVRTSDVTDARLIAAMLAVPRERFLPAAQADLAYLGFDAPVPVVQADRPARRLLKPMVLAKLVQAAEVAGGDHVLDVGGATGYASAVLARLAGSVVALEEDAGLAELARQNLRALGASQVQVTSGPL